MDTVLATALPSRGQLSGFLTSVFARWAREGIRFVILRNYDELPQHLGNDLDVLVEPADLSRAESLLRECASKAGYRLYNRAQFSCVSLFFSDSDFHYIHVDLFSRIEWRGLESLPTDLVLRTQLSRGLFATPSPVHEASINLLNHLLHHRYVRERYKKQVLRAFASERQLAMSTLSIPFGKRAARHLVRQVIAERWDIVAGRTWRLRLRLLVRCLARQPGATVRSLCRTAQRLARRYIQPPGLFVVLLGPDGCGKSTVARELMDRLGPAFLPERTSYIHWKPRILPSGRRQQLGPNTEPHGSPQRHRILSAAYFAFHLAGFALGGLLRIRTALFRNGLVVCDRYYYDFFVDLRRYRLNVPIALVRSGSWLVQQPDVVICLDASAELLCRRKQEVSTREADRQRLAFRLLANDVSGGHLIDASGSLEKTVRETMQVILDHLAMRTSAAGPQQTSTCQGSRA